MSEAAAGKVCTGFSKPYVALYVVTGTTVDYTEGQQLARGVSVRITPETSSDNNFYADNVAAESEMGMFTGGTCELVVDGLHPAAERLILGMPEPETLSVGNKQVKVDKYGDGTVVPYVGIGFIVKYVSNGVTTYVPTVLRKGKFSMPSADHKTAENQTQWQTQTLSAALHRDDSDKHDWKWTAEDQPTETDAEAVLKAMLNIQEDAA